ncbi:MAG: hypothetical protein Kow0077_30770 [Anaerolineae bacterium]
MAGRRAALWLALGLLVLGILLGVAIWVLAEPPFLTWAHGATLTPAVQAYVDRTLPGETAVRVTFVREYTPTCAVLRAEARRAGDVLRFWALLYRDGAEGEWEVVLAESVASSAAPLVAWGQHCGEPPGRLPEPPPLILP